MHVASVRAAAEAAAATAAKATAVATFKVAVGSSTGGNEYDNSSAGGIRYGGSNAGNSRYDDTAQVAVCMVAAIQAAVGAMESTDKKGHRQEGAPVRVSVRN